MMVSVCGTPELSVPTTHSPVAGSYVPWLGVADTKVRPAGRRSVTSTPVASSGPLLVNVTVNVIWSPTFGVASLTVLSMARLARWGVSVALAVLLALLGSNWSLSVTVAVLVRAMGLVTAAVIVSTVWVPLASAPTSQMPLVLSYVPWPGVADTNVRPIGKRSVTATPVAPFGPLLTSVTMHVI